MQLVIIITGITSDILSKYPHELDDGNRKTVSIARSIAHKEKRNKAYLYFLTEKRIL